MILGSLTPIFILVMTNSFGGLLLFLLSLFCIPILFIIPVAIKKTKLILIPGIILFGLFVLSVIIFAFSNRISDLFFSLSLIGAAVLGVLAGFSFRPEKCKKNMSIMVGVLSPIISWFLIFHFIILFLFNNPIGTFFANFRIQAYVAEHFYDFDLEVSYPQYVTLKGNWFDSTITLRGDENFSFRIFHHPDGSFTTHYVENHSWQHPYREQVIEDLTRHIEQAHEYEIE